MVDRADNPMHSTIAAEVQIPFNYTVIHGEDPSRRSPQYKAVTRSLSLTGLIFETQKMEADGFHLSFTGGTFARNFLEISLDLGKRFSTVEVLSQVEFYERRSTIIGHAFLVGVSFVDVHVEALAALRDFLQQTQTLLRQGSPRRRGE
ncbi:MAG: hypothetical protein ACLP5H_01740 [Desulfomonilaceae bacterium]